MFIEIIDWNWHSIVSSQSNQEIDHLIWFAFVEIFLTELKKQLWIKQNRGECIRKFWLVLFFKYYFQKYYGFFKRSNSSGKKML